MILSLGFSNDFPRSSRLARLDSYSYLCRRMEICCAMSHTLSLHSSIYMAIVRSAAVGSARGSLGNITYRQVRGRTIGSLKRGGVDPATRAEGETLVQFIFGLLARFVSIHGVDIAVSFDATKYGSPRNAFMKLNYPAFLRALQPLFQTGLRSADIPSSQLEQTIADYAVEHPQEIYRAKKGSVILYLDGAWDSEDNPVETAKISVSGIAIDGKTLSDNSSISIETSNPRSFIASVTSENVTDLSVNSVSVKFGNNSPIACTDVNLAGSSLTAKIKASSSIEGSGQVISVVVKFMADGVEVTKTINFDNVNVDTTNNPI